MKNSFTFALIVWCVALFGKSPASGGRAVSESHASPLQVRELLGVRGGGDEARAIVAEYANNIGTKAADVTRSAVALRLSEALREGVSEDLFTRVSVAITTVEHIIGDPGEGAKWHGALIELSKELTKLAKSQVEGSEDGDRYARAALLLASNDRVVLADLMLAGMLQDPALIARVKGSPETRESLSELGRALADARMAVRPYYAQTSADLKALIDASGDEQAWQERLPSLISNLRDGWRLSAGQLKVRLFLAGDAWRVVCLARASKRDDAVRQMRDIVDELKAATPDDPIASAWLDQILTKPGPAPKAPTIRIIKSPNDMKPRTP